MKRFILPEAPDKAGMVHLSGSDYHYLVRVRRFTAGAEFSALLPDGAPTRVRVRSISAAQLAGECLPERPCERGAPTPVPTIALFQALPKGVKMDLIVRQAAEGGVSEIVPFVSAYSVPKIEGGMASDKQARWERIVREARQQSGSEVATEIHTPLSFDGLLSHWEVMKNQYSVEAATGIFLHPAALLSPASASGSFHACLEAPPGYVALAVGPEGGFSAEEAARFIAADFQPLDLGNSILRTETAAVYAVAAVRIILLERASWIRKSPL
ncbi:MAG: 16S rRNA (uracil(1498)-N(3))-methyltransferase [Treponema sp.]|jgi:16S rRNA (uracil1498-N3)-methyltransferase|nr:16S rRNA (uracil(1498)-N(3))-methyltransferase [Treponema sp.]